MSATVGQTGDRKKVVVGGSHLDFLNWCRENDVPPTSVIRPTFKEHLLGLEIAKEDIVRLGWLSPAFEEILETRIRL